MEGSDQTVYTGIIQADLSPSFVEAFAEFRFCSAYICRQILLLRIYSIVSCLDDGCQHFKKGLNPTDTDAHTLFGKLGTNTTMLGCKFLCQDQHVNCVGVEYNLTDGGCKLFRTLPPPTDFVYKEDTVIVTRTCGEVKNLPYI